MASSFKDTTITGNLTVSGSLSIGSLVLKDKLSMTNNTYTFDIMKIWYGTDSGRGGFGVCLDGQGTTIIGAGNYGMNLMSSTANNTDNVYMITKDHFYFMMSNNKHIGVDNNLSMYPNATDTGSLGTSTYKWNTCYVRSGNFTIGNFGSINSESVLLNNNSFIKGKNTSGTQYIVAGISSGNILYLGDRNWTGNTSIYGGTIYAYSDNAFQVRTVSNTTYFYANQSCIMSTGSYSTTVTGSANVRINSNGTICRSTSASKYKLNIDNINQDEYYPYRLLRINPKQWFDKNLVEAYSAYISGEIKENEEPESNELKMYKELLSDVTVDPIYGLVAEDLEEAGLEKFCMYKLKDNDEKELEGISYERLPILLIPMVRDLVLAMQDIIPAVKDNIKDNTIKEKIEKLESKFNSFNESDIVKNIEYVNR